MCALSNINKIAYFTQHAQCMLLFLVLTGNSTWFRILHSYMLVCSYVLLGRVVRERERGDREQKEESYILSPDSVLITAFLIMRLWLIMVSNIWKCFKYVVPGSLFLCVFLLLLPARFQRMPVSNRTVWHHLGKH